MIQPHGKEMRRGEPEGHASKKRNAERRQPGQMQWKRGNAAAAYAGELKWDARGRGKAEQLD